MQRRNSRTDDVLARELLEQRAEDNARREGDTTYFQQDQEDEEEVAR